jgi:hypothetical protein
MQRVSLKAAALARVDECCSYSMSLIVISVSGASIPTSGCPRFRF